MTPSVLVALALPVVSSALAAPAPAAEPRAYPSPAQRAVAIERWASDAPVLVVAEIELAAPVQGEDPSGLRTELGLHIVEVLRDDLALDLAPGDRLWMEIPGGELGDLRVYSSEAPLMFEGDTVLARLEVELGEPVFTRPSDVIPMDGEQARLCVNPTPAGLDRCDGEGAAVLFDPALPSFATPDLGLDLSLTALRAALY